MGFFTWLFGENEVQTRVDVSVKAERDEESKAILRTSKQTSEEARLGSEKAKDVAKAGIDDHTKLAEPSKTVASAKPVEEPKELGVRQKIDIANGLNNSVVGAVTHAWITVFENLFPTPTGTVNQIFLMCMQVATAWLVMQWYDLSHKKRTAQIMGWYELATRSKLVPHLISSMHSRKYQSEAEKTATGVDLMMAKIDSYAAWIHAAMEDRGVTIEKELIKSELMKARESVQPWYNHELVEFVKNQQPWEPVLPSQLSPGSREMMWLTDCKREIAVAKW